ncbi:MAG: hypothetical protein AAFR38_08130 [Planctomycetota bacterium]
MEFATLAADQNGTIIVVASVVLGCLVAMTAIIMAGATQIEKNKQREESRREIAAYVAEGSMTPEQGERMLVAGNNDDNDNEA